MYQSPSVNGANGRDANGRFAAGNAGGPGNPHVAKTAKLRSTMLNAVSQKDMREIVNAMVERAKAGDVAAAREVMDRCFGKASQAVEVTEQPAGDNEPDPMTCDDMELARMIQAGGLELPKMLAEKVKRAEEQERAEAGDAGRTQSNGAPAKP